MNNRLYFMDSLRAFTIWLVLFFHLSLLYTAFQAVQNPVPEQYTGIFMGISALINGQMLNSIMFFTAGFFAFETYRKKGCVSDIFKRPGLPYIAGFIRVV